MEFVFSNTPIFYFSELIKRFELKFTCSKHKTDEYIYIDLK